MDTTKEYIDMCMALPDEIRAAWDPHAGDFVFAKHGFSDYDFRKESDNGVLGIITKVQEGTFSIEPCGEDGEAAWYSIKHSIPLWRQAQTQEMHRLHRSSNYKFGRLNMYGLTHHRSDFVFGILGLDATNSKEQLWLAFVMYEKYGLKWSSEQKGWI